MFTISPLLAFEFPAVSTIVGWLLFGAIGTIAVGYGKMKEEWPPALIGFALMLYPYFFSSGIAFWVIGVVLTILFLLPKRILGF